MSRIFVGHLPNDVKERQLQEYFSKYGTITSFMLRFLHRAPPFAFIEYRNADDAMAAVREADGRYFESSRMRVEISEGHDELSWPRTTQHRVIVSNLPSNVTRRELRDLLERGADVVDVTVDKRGNGTASFPTYGQLQRARRVTRRQRGDYGDNNNVFLLVVVDAAIPTIAIPLPLSLSFSLAISFSVAFPVSLSASIASITFTISIATTNLVNSKNKTEESK
ncbi:hypothetical protein PINS_up006517 [Pythium insidiosum]|nr:hypothetical protein PINS_up006517 [Pythium insidiosum]